MATSDSEDFESADEDLLDDSKKELNKILDLEAYSRPSPSGLSLTHTSHLGRTDINPVIANQSKNDDEVGDALNTAHNEENPLDSSSIELGSAKGGMGVNKLEGQDLEQVPDEIPAERKRRQKKHREPVTSRAPKKLGTKINDKTMHPISSSNAQTGGPRHESGNESNENMEKLVCDKGSDQLDLTQNTGAVVIDPYAKFKGYSLPPSIQRCWVDGVDNVVKDDSQLPTKLMKPEDELHVAPVLDKLSQFAADKADSTWGGWGNWGVTSLLTSATEGVSTLTSHVSSVLESGIGAPDPEELARIDQLEEKKFEADADANADADAVGGRPSDRADSQEEPTGMFNFGQLLTSMSSITKLVETTSSKVLSGGLDTLETIGKKTMEVLQEGDPGLKKKRAMFSDTTVLSQILREAKEKAEREDKEAEDKQALRNIHFETLFDDYQGLIHLEALEMLSKQCDLKLQTLLLSASGAALSQLQERLQELKEACQLPDDEEVNDEESDADDWWRQLAAAEEALGIPVATDKLDRIWKETQHWLTASVKDKEKVDGLGTPEFSAKEIHKKAVTTLAQLTATSVEQFHKGAELLLIKENRNSSREAEMLKQITSVLCVQVSTAATHFCERLNNCTEEGNLESVNSLITNIFLEASNSSSYIQEAFQLLIPVLQVGITS